MSIQEAILTYAEEPLSRQLLFSILKDYRRPYDKINELVKAGLLIGVKNGFYVAGAKLKGPKVESFLIANHLYGPSYISVESALSYWKLIPEKVFEINSITIKRSKVFKTPVGRFRYFSAPVPYYSFGVKSVSLTQKQAVLIAGVEKALCDKVVFTVGVRLRSVRETIQFLTEDLRIDEEALRTLNLKEIKSWIKDAPKKTSIEMLVKTLEQL